MNQRAWLAAAATALTALACERRVEPTGPGQRLPAPTGAVSAALAAPTPLGPDSGAGVTVPFAISWSAVIDPTSLNGGYNWQVSASPTFSPLVIQDATRPNETQDVVSGLPNGTYYWRVNAVNAALETSAWSETRSFTVTGAGAGTPGTPTLGPTQGYSTFHPWEVIRFNWSDVPDAVTYRVEISSDRNFPAGQLQAGTFMQAFDNIPDPSYALQWGAGEGNYFFARVFAVSADNPENGVRSLPSNVIGFSVFYANPVGPAPAPLSPINGETLTLPITLKWAHVPNPQPSGYEVQVSSDPSFKVNEAQLGVQLTEPQFLILSLTPGTKYWRVRSHQGMSSPTTTATTAWSATGTFTLSTAPPTPVSIKPVRTPLYSGDDTWVEVQLTAGVSSSGATVAVASSNPGVAPVPATLAMPGGDALAQFQMKVGQVTSPTPVTLTATLNGATAKGDFVVQPPSLKSLTFAFPDVSGGTPAGATLMLNGQAPVGGAVVSLTSNSPAATPPATVTVPAGGYSAPVSIPTGNVTASTPVTITASWNGGSAQGQITVRPSPAPTSLTLTPSTVVGGDAGSVDGLVTIAAAAAYDQTLQVTSDNRDVLPFLSPSVLVPAGSTRGAISIMPRAVSVTTIVTISVTGGGVTRSADLTVNPPNTPPPPPALSAFTVSPTSVAGGTAATGTVALPSAAPSGGTVVSLSSRLPGLASVPPSVTVPAGATSASFTVTTFATSSSTVVELAATLGGTTLFAPLTVGPPAAPAAPSLLSPATDATPAQPVTFDWSDVANAVSYEIQIDNSSTIAAPFVANQTVTASTASIGGLPAERLWWRVRARNSAGVFGPFSTTRRFTPKAASTTPTLSAVGLNPTSVTGGSRSTGTVTLTGSAPSGGVVVSLSSSNANVAGVPASVTVAAGTSSASFTATTVAVSASTGVTVTAASGGVTRTATLTVNPASTTLAAPTLASPAVDQVFSVGQAITFDWSDVSGAASYTIQIDDDSRFPAPLVLGQTVTASQLTTSTLPRTRMWWRVRANSTAGTPGSWSTARRFEVK